MFRLARCIYLTLYVWVDNKAIKFYRYRILKAPCKVASHRELLSSDKVISVIWHIIIITVLKGEEDPFPVDEQVPQIPSIVINKTGLYARNT